MTSLVKQHPIICLAFLAFALGFAPLVAVNAGLLPSAATQLGALSASLAAFILAAIENGRAGLRELFGRVLVWRVGWRWWAFVLLFPVLPSVASLYLFHLFGGPAPEWSTLKPLWNVIPLILILTVLAGLGEEFGWRGFALPRLQRRFSAFWSSLIIGTIWGMWHIPLFLTEGTVQNSWLQEGGWVIAIGGYTVFCIAWAIQYTWVFNSTGGSVLLTAVMHGAGNAWFGGYIDVYRGHIGGIASFTALMIVMSAVIVVTAGPSHLSRRRQKNVLSPDI